MDKKIFRGIISEPMVSFYDDGSIDFDTTEKIYRNLASRGAAGLFVNGFGNECYTLSLEERLDVVKCAQKAVAGTDCKVVAVVLVNCLKDALWLIEKYNELKVDAMCFSLPPFWELLPEAKYQYLAEQLKLADCPCMLFNCREMDEFMEPELIGRLAKDFPDTCKGYKDATRDIIHFTKTVMAVDEAGHLDDFSFISGSDATLYAHMLLGATASVTYMSVPFFDQMKAIYDNVIKGDLKAAWEAQKVVVHLRDFMQRTSSDVPYIYAMRFQTGIEVKGTRNPSLHNVYSEEDIQAFEALLDELGIQH